MAEPFLPYGRQEIDEQDIAAVVEALGSDWLTTGPKVAEFEAAFAAKVGVSYAVACNSGTAALHMAVTALGIGEGDKVVVPTITFLASANCVRFNGAEVVFADVNPATGLLGPATFLDALERAGDGVKGVIPVHLAGQVADVEAIRDIARARGISVIEDACHALGTTYGSANDASATVGACVHSDAATFSFHPVKTIAMGEGGMVTTNDADRARCMSEFRNHGMVRDPQRLTGVALAFDGDGAVNPWYYEMPEIGFNYRASDINCALGLSQLAKLERFVDRRLALAGRYDQALAPLAPVVRPGGRVENCRAGWHLYTVRIDFDAAGKSRAAVMNGLRESGVGTQVHYVPVHRQPYYVGRYGELSLPGADAYYASTLSLPLFPAMTDADVDRVCDALRRVTSG